MSNFSLLRPEIRQATASDTESIWEIFHAVVARGDTYTFDPEISREEALAYWLYPSNWSYVAWFEQKVVGTYILRVNQPALGVGRAMGEHSLIEARRLGFRAMQFNFVVSTNEPAIHLWRELGFKIVGTLPGAFRHLEKGFVDAYVMFRSLTED